MSAKRRPPIAHVPLKDRANCDQCGELVDTRANGVGEVVHGVAINRQQGGANMIALMERQHRWLCRPCIDLRKRGHKWEQTKLDLFGESDG